MSKSMVEACNISCKELADAAVRDCTNAGRILSVDEVDIRIPRADLETSESASAVIDTGRRFNLHSHKLG